MAMRPGEILDAQIDLIERLGQEQFADTIAFLAAHHLGGAPVSGEIERSLELRPQQDRIMREYGSAPLMLKNHLMVGSAYRVTHDMCQMVEWMATQLEDDDLFFRALLPTEAGIVCFDKPLALQDIRGKTMLIHWLIWGPGHTFDRFTREKQSGTVMWCFNDTWRTPDEVMEHFREQYVVEDPEHGAQRWANYMYKMGRWATVGMCIVKDRAPMGGLTWTPSEKQRLEVEREGFEALPGTNSVRYFQALIMLLNQTTTSVSEEDTDRPARRRAIKKGIPPKVTVIKLRRHDSEDREPGESEVEWSHRWIVRRHWRWQPYGSRATDCMHEYGPVEPQDGSLVRYCVHGCDHRLERIIINPYIKGPVGAPLVQSQKVYSLER